ncbi:MAG: S8 family serine peptidase [Candidatus Riflebacteria bacterium]|nr:S8 family serine peptidase [Candidatus Riflebacteria bacterium]
MNRRLWVVVLLVMAALPVLGGEIPYRPYEPVEIGAPFTDADAAGRRPARCPHGHTVDDPFLDKQYPLCNHGQADDKGQTGSAGCDIGGLEARLAFKPQQEIILAIVDSGLELNHPDVDPAVLWTNPGESGTDAEGRDKAANGVDDDGNGYIDDVHGWNFCRNSPDINEDHYHGTHVGGLLCAPANNGTGIAGACPGVKIMLVKIFGLGSSLGSEQIATAIRYAVDNGARVLSNSYGSPSFTQAMKDAIAYTAQKGALFVCASGNSRKNMDLEEEQDYPSCYGVENQLVVGATNNRDLSTFCNFGSMVEIAAPGENIFSLFPKGQYRSFSGTSQACPLVAGAATMVWMQHPDWTWRQVKRAVLDSADQVRGLSRYVVGGLRLNLFNALTGRPGRRLPAEDFSQWREEARTLESPHPYPNQKTLTFDLAVPGARKLRVHFARLAIDHFGDSLTLRDGGGGLVEYINGIHAAGWSEVIEGDRVQLVLEAGDYINEFGFVIDAVQWLP